MKGRIYARGKCPLCGGSFVEDATGYACPVHLIPPKRFYIQLYLKDIHKKVNLCSDSRGNPFSSYDQADRILTKIRAEVDEGKFDATRYIAQKLKPLRFSNWAKEWLKKKRIESQKGLLSPSYAKALGVYVRKYESFFGETDIRDIGTKRIHEFYLSLDGKPHYIKNILTALEKLFHDALDWGDIGLLPKFPKVNVPDPDTEIIDIELQDKIVASIPNPMDRAFILFTAREMVRPSETRALQWPDLDLKHGRVKIRWHFSLNELRPTTKSKRNKWLPLDGEVKAALEKLPQHLKSPFVFWKRDGLPFSESWARKLWRRTSSALGVNVSLYQGTRHSSATEAADRVGVDAVQEFLDHTNRKTALRYVQRNPERLKKVLRK